MAKQRSVEELVAECKKLKVGRPKEEGFHDDKHYCSLTDILALLEAGATSRQLNRAAIGGVYCHTVMFGGYKFISVTTAPVNYFYRYDAHFVDSPAPSYFLKQKMLNIRRS